MIKTGITNIIQHNRLIERNSKLITDNTDSGYSSSMCLYCKGGKLICGKLSCPVITNVLAMTKHKPKMESTEIHGNTPPGVFVGNSEYPKVFIGPMIPPYYGNTEILDTPEKWIGKSLEEIIDYRYSLIRGKSKTKITEPQSGGKLLDSLQELAMSTKPVDSEIKFTKKPNNKITLSSDALPFGPSAPLKSFKVSNVKVDKRIEKAYYDKDLKASKAIIDLFSQGISVTRIQRAFSMGMFGLGKKRKLVPTRWSITAIDNNISATYLENIKQFETIDEYRVYKYKNLDNIFIIILSPENWKYECIEAWFPGTTWNEKGNSPEIMGDYESYKGRKTYASIGGCYYSARLALAEKLMDEKKQGSALVLREIHPGYILPVGVWNVRESMRSALRIKPVKFDTLNAAIKYACKSLTIPLKKWLETSILLKQLYYQKKISEYF